MSFPVTPAARRVSAAALALVAVAAAPAGAHDITFVNGTVYSAVAGPRFWSSRSLSPYSRLDCSITSANPYWRNNGCTLTVKTQLDGCYWEVQTSDPQPRTNTECAVTISGAITWRRAVAHCALASEPLGLEVTYTVGSQPGRLLSPAMFQATAVLKPKTLANNGLATRAYTMTVTANEAPASVTSGTPLVALGSLNEVFEVYFTSPISDACPNADTNALSVGSVRDSISDTAPDLAAMTGFLRLDVIAA